MSVTKTLNTAVSGLRAQQEALGIVGDNIANKRGKIDWQVVFGYGFAFSHCWGRYCYRQGINEYLYLHISHWFIIREWCSCR